MIHCKELKQDFDSREDLFKALAENEDIIHGAKKSEIYKSIDKGLQIVTDQKGIEKALNTEENKAIKFDNDYYYFVVNSSNVLDSHNDMHVEGNWKKTVKEQQGKVFLVFDHTLKRSEIIAMKEDVELLTAKIPFSLLGKSYEGESYCLIYKVKKDKIINKDAKEWLENGYSLEASVRMQYVKLRTAFKSSNPEYAKQNETYEEFYPLIANKEDFSEEIIYFYVIEEAKNVYESSLVLFGSNGATGLLNNENKSEAVDDTTEPQEPSDDTQEEVKRKLSVI